MSCPVFARKAGDEMRVGQKPAVEHQVGVERHAVLEAEALEGQHQPRARVAVARHRLEDLPQLVDGEVRRVHDLVGHRADLREHLPLFVDRIADRPVRAPADAAAAFR